MKEKKITKREKFERLLKIEEVAADAELKEFVEKEIASLDAKAEKAKERAAKKKAEMDTLCDEVYAVIAEKGTVTLQELVDTLSVDNEEVTSAKIVARLSKLVTAEKIEKAEKTIEKRKLMTYFVKEAE